MAHKVYGRASTSMPSADDAHITLGGHKVAVGAEGLKELRSKVGETEDLDNLLSSTMRKCRGRPQALAARELCLASFLLDNWDEICSKVKQVHAHDRVILQEQVQREERAQALDDRITTMATDVCLQMVQAACLSTGANQLQRALDPLAKAAICTPGLYGRVVGFLKQLQAWVLEEDPAPEQGTMQLWEMVYAPVLFHFLIQGDESVVNRTHKRLQTLIDQLGRWNQAPPERFASTA